MSKPIMVTLNQIEKHTPYYTHWDEVFKIDKGIEKDPNKPFPLSIILDSNGIEITLRCFRALREHKSILEKFALFCAKEASTRTDNKVIHKSVKMLEKHVLKSNVKVEKLQDIYKAVCNVVSNAKIGHCTVDNYASHAVKNAIETILITDIVAAANAAESTAYYTATYPVKTSVDEEVKKLTDYLRKLLNGEPSNILKTQENPWVCSFISRIFKKCSSKN